VVILNYTYHALLNLYDVNICSSDIGVNLQIYSNYLSRILRQGCMVQEKQNFSSVKIISVSSRKHRRKLSRPAEINLTSVGRRQADGSYGDNFHRMGKPTEVRRLNPITRTRPVPASTPTLRSVTAAAPSSNPYRPPAGSSTPPPPLQSAPPRAPPHPDRLVAPACCCPRLSLSLSPSLSRASHARRRRLRPGCLPGHRRPADARPLHRFLGHLPRHRQPTPSITTWPGLASPGPRPTRPGHCRLPPLATRPPDSLHRPTPDVARLP
jgi:hypothetical protein